MTHITYATAKALKEFCPELPEAMEDHPLAYYGKDLLHYVPAEKETEMHKQIFSGFAYQLHDILSREFCEAFGKVCVRKTATYEEELYEMWWEDYSVRLHGKYMDGGLPAVEAELMRMMAGK